MARAQQERKHKQVRIIFHLNINLAILTPLIYQFSIPLYAFIYLFIQYCPARYGPCVASVAWTQFQLRNFNMSTQKNVLKMSVRVILFFLYGISFGCLLFGQQPYIYFCLPRREIYLTLVVEKLCLHSHKYVSHDLKR